MIADILIPLISVGLAELGDKTQLSILLLSSKTKKHLHLLLGVMLAFLIADGAAVLVGLWATNIVPIGLLKILSGIIFIICGVLILRNHVKSLISQGRKSEHDEVKDKSKSYFKNPFISGFVLVLITEWGDKTQIVSGLFATRYNALMVLIGTMIALALLSIIAIYLGKFVSNEVDKKVMTKIAGTIFILMGISFFLF